MNQRDWKLAQAMPGVMDTIVGLRQTALVIFKGREHEPKRRSVQLIQEAGDRYVELVTGLSIATMEYHEGMEERALHAWAKRVVDLVEKSPE